MDAIQTFSCTEFGTIRTIELNGEPWFVGKDVAQALGYSDTAKAIRVHVDAEDKGVDEMDTPGGKQTVCIINESGLYSLVLSSKLPTAKKFKRWVTSEILPALRKTGVYTVQECNTRRPLTTDDYISAAQIISRCRDSRLPIVLDLLDKGGFDTVKLEHEATVKKAKRHSDVRLPQKSAIETDDPLIALLWEHTTSEVEKLTGINRGSISFYRRGIHKCPDDRRELIMSIFK